MEPKAYQLPEAAKVRLRAIYEQWRALGQRYDEMAFMALEALGAKPGKIIQVNFDLGIVVVEEDEPPPKPNRAERRRKAKEIVEKQD